MVRRKWAIIGVVATATVLACLYALSLPSIYRSTVTLLIDSGTSKVLSIDDVNSGAQQHDNYQTQVEIIQSREVAERAARSVRLWDRREFDPRVAQRRWVESALVALKLRQPTETPVWTDVSLAGASADQLMRQMSVEAVRLSQLVKVSIDANDPVLAAQLANTLAEQYIAADRAARLSLSESITLSLQERLASLRARMLKSEQSLQDYREKHNVATISGSSLAIAGQQVNATTERLLTAKARRLELESTYAQLRGIANGNYQNVPSVMRDPAVVETTRQLNAANQRLLDLSETLGPRHSRMIQAEAEKSQLTEVLAQQRAAAAAGLTREYEAARSTEQSLELALGSVRTNVQDSNRDEFQLAALQREVQANSQLYDMFATRAKEVTLASEVQSSVARVVDRATPVDVPVKPARTRIVLSALLLASALAIGASVQLDRLDDTLRTVEQGEATLGLPVLSAIPQVKQRKSGLGLRYLNQPSSHFAEAVRTARTGILLSKSDVKRKVILVTSALPGEGKTTFAINLAHSLARTGRTLFIDADMRRFDPDRLEFGRPGKLGLAELLSSQAEIAACCHRTRSGLYVMPAGELAPNPLELLLSQRFRDLLAFLPTHFDAVVVDSPSLELVSEALVIAPLVTGTVFVVKGKSTPTPVARQAIERIHRAGGTFLGLVVNQLGVSREDPDIGEYRSDPLIDVRMLPVAKAAPGPSSMQVV